MLYGLFGESHHVCWVPYHTVGSHCQRLLVSDFEEKARTACEYVTYTLHLQSAIPSFRFLGELEDAALESVLTARFLRFHLYNLLASFVPSLPDNTESVTPITEPTMSLRSACCLAHPSRAWLLLCSLLILLLWLPFTSAFGVSGRPLKSSRDVGVSRRHMFPVVEMTAVVTEATAAVAEGDFFPVVELVAVIALRVLGGYLLGTCLGYVIMTPSIREIRSEMHKTNKELDDLQPKIESINRKLQSLNQNRF